ncbi:MAG TPA: hypothetical protein VM779_09765 [Thermoanaerobaculia bacterium]|nr:hypothetical protein [Thermoanaerobaculia bacterium]
MTERCVHEPQVRLAAVEDRWTDALLQHVSRCDDCAAAGAAAPFMTAFARTDARRRPLPDPAVIWLKARLLRGSVDADRAVRPLNVMQAVAYLVIAAGWAALLTWKWSDVERWILSVTPSNMVGELAGIHSSVPATVVLAIVVLSSLTVMVALHAILAEE